MIWLALRQPLLWIVAGCAMIAAVLWMTGSLTRGKQAEAVAKIEAGRADAATKSGQDAVATVGTVGARDSAEDDLSRRNGDAIRTAPGAGAPIDRGIAAAGRDGLCQRRAYRCTPDCLQRAVAAGMARAGAGCAAPAK